MKLSFLPKCKVRDWLGSSGSWYETYIICWIPSPDVSSVAITWAIWSVNECSSDSWELGKICQTSPIGEPSISFIAESLVSLCT